MKFVSTRGGTRDATLEDVLTLGYAPDGGLFVPEALPNYAMEDLHRLRKLNFADLAEAIIAPFVGDELGPRSKLAAIIRDCYSEFADQSVVPVKRVGNLLVSELFHGPTFCFKDLGLQPLMRLLAAFAERRQRYHTLLVSTTGDTGPAAMRAVKDVSSPYLKMVVFFPEGQISDLQRRQMTTMSSEHARVVTFQGGGDDMDLPIKRMSADQAFAKRYGLCGINSFNFGRPMAQMVHYFWTYFRAIDASGLSIGDQIDIAVPSGALGNLTAGFMCKKMGLPIRRFVAGVNANDITHRTISKGEFHRSENMVKTLSDAINIQVPYNMERIFYYLLGEDASTTRKWMAAMADSGKMTLPTEWLQRLQEVFSSQRVDDECMCKTLLRAYESHGYLADPHTAVALRAAWDTYGYAVPAIPVAVLATASPCKFQAAVTKAIGASRWSEFTSSDGFPQTARNLLTLPENGLATLVEKDTLQESQVSWESEVRRWLQDSRHPETATLTSCL